jgi:hypothetical protein
MKLVRTETQWQTERMETKPNRNSVADWEDGNQTDRNTVADGVDGNEIEPKLSGSLRGLKLPRTETQWQTERMKTKPNRNSVADWEDGN